MKVESFPVLEAAREYIKRGWSVVPLNGKACIGPDWQKVEFVPEMFKPGDNIGVKLVRGLVDVDCDARETVDIAADFLPPTGCVYGRPNKPKAHWFYEAKIEKLVKFVDGVTTDKGKATLIELRVNHQSMAPPSIHPDDGQTLEWEQPFGAAGAVDGQALLRCVRLIATCAMIIRYYNPPGDRHDWGVALAGTLKQLGLNEEEAKKILTVAARQANDSKVVDRLRALQDTYHRGEEEPTKGAKALAEGMGNGQAFVTTLRRIWGSGEEGAPTSMVAELNKKHAVIFQQSGDVVVMTEDQDVHGRPFLRFSSPSAFRDLYPQPVIVGYTPRGAKKTKALGSAWFDSPNRRLYEGIELAPNGNANPKYYNMWRGFAVEPKPGSWNCYQDHLYEVICNQNTTLTEYFISWMANTVQKPGHPAETAIAMRGEEGVGKGMVARFFGALFGPHFVQLDSTRHLTGNFNAHLHNAIVVFADEAAWPGDKAGLGALKRLITEPTLSIERKGMDIFTVQNLIHMLMASNEEWVAPVGPEGRRFVVVDANNRYQDNYDYFGKLKKQMEEEGGLSAMLHDLMNYQIKINLRKIPATQALWEQKVLSMQPHQRWWFQALMERGDWWTNRVEADIYLLDYESLVTDYAETLKKVGQSRISLGTELGMRVKSLIPDPYPIVFRDTTRKKYWKIPSLQRCREHFMQRFRISRSEVNWPDPPAPDDPELRDMF